MKVKDKRDEIEWNSPISEGAPRLQPDYTVNKIFSSDEEKVLSNYFETMANLHHDLNPKCAKKLTYGLALANKNLEKEEKLKGARKSSLNRNSSITRQLDDTLKPCKIQKKKKKLSESSSSADDNIEQLTDSDDINIFPESEVENDFLKNDLSTITTDSFVLVKFPTKKTIKYYIGRIIHKISSEEFNITFLRRQGSNFVFPNVPDISAVTAHDIILHLMQPEKIGGTSRTANLSSFLVDLYDVN
ncbi:hypothetical protein HHI36_012425 [Cryptolaemus montrouzieri]|uniref:Uncharacterized protein n=1 Tax=Cryptolaemus montrouzieri TaxID=559131 RepID=A0ABD2NEN9_9CUCU